MIHANFFVELDIINGSDIVRFWVIERTRREWLHTEFESGSRSSVRGRMCRFLRGQFVGCSSLWNSNKNQPSLLHLRDPTDATVVGMLELGTLTVAGALVTQSQRSQSLTTLFIISNGHPQT